MKIVLQSYDEELTVETLTGTSIHIRPSEIKKELGVAGTTDQLVITVSLPVRVGKPFEHVLGGQRVYVVVGEDHWDEFEPKGEEHEPGEFEDDEWVLVLGEGGGD